MKRHKLFFGLILALAFVARENTVASTPALFGIHVVITSKAYWDGPSKSCLPREKGGCCHMWTDNMPGPGQIVGELSNAPASGLQLKISQTKGIDKETFMNHFRNGRFDIRGPITFEPEVLSKLGLSANFTVAQGEYPYTVNGDEITIRFK
jgi:hypothetical protein